MAMHPSIHTQHSGRINHARFLSATALTAAGMVLLAAPAAADNWTDHTAVVGNISIDTSIPSTTNITQHTHFTKVQGNGDINAGWTVNVAQPSSSSKYVLYDTKDDPTRILGSLNANGEIYIFDQNGVIFGADSRVDVGSLITSTGHIADADILDNDGRLTFVDVADGAIELNGTISVAEAGLAAFVAPTISNSGVINAKMGKVAMGAGEKVTLDLYGDNLVEIALDDKLSGALIDNSGVINAAGGTIVLKAEAAKDIVNNVINMSGAINASSASVQGGKIVLGGGSEGIVTVSGTLDASGATGGGEIAVTGENIEVTQTAEINADAIQNGDGGEVLVYGDQYALFDGVLSARGGSESGHGGNAEISGGEAVGFSGLVDLSAQHGENGTLLIDPRHLTISDADFSGDLAFWLSGSANGTVNINDQALADTLRYSNVNLWATESLSTGSDIDISTWMQACGAICQILGGSTQEGITTNNLTLAAPTINLLHDIVLGTGQLNIYDLAAGTSALGFGLINVPAGGINVDIVNLDGVISRRDTVGGTLSEAGDDQINSQAHIVNVLSNAAKIQQAVYLADDAGGATVNVAAGTYEEQVDINKSLSLVGAGQGATVVTSPVLLNESFNNGNSNKAVIYAHDADAINISGLTIDGQGRGNGNNRLFGLLYKDAGGTVDDIHVTRMTDTPVSGSQHGNAVFNYNTDGVARSWTIRNSTIDSFQKNGITANGAGLTANILNNKVTGNGPLGPSQAAQNGIQVSRGALGNIDGNTISAISYTPPTYSATGILLYSAAAGTSVTNNIYHGSGDDAGIYVYDTADTVVSGNMIDGTSRYGLVLNAANGANASGNMITGAQYGIDSSNTDDVTISGNTVDGNGNGINGISLSLGSNATVSGNIVTGNTDTPAKRAANDYATGMGILVDEMTGTINVSGNISTNNTDGIRIRNTDGVLVSGNSANNNQDKGIIFKFSDDGRILENTVTGNDIGLYLDGSANGQVLRNTLNNNAKDGIHLRDASNHTYIANNFIHGNGRAGLYAENAGGAHAPVTNVTAFDNSFTGNAKNIINTTAQTVNASGNWWGAVNDAHINGTMTGSVDFSPYLASGSDRDAAANGFQGDFSHVYATTLGGQAGSTGRIQEAIDLLTDGAKTGGNRLVNLNDGTYNESGINVNKSLTMDGVTATAGNVIIQGTGATDGLNLSADDLTLRYFTVDGHRNGIYTNSVIDDLFMRNINISNNANYGIGIHNNAVVDGMDLRNLRITNNNVGMRIRGSVNNLDMHGGLVSGNNQGIVSNFGNNDDGTYLTDVAIRDVTFTNNAHKGLYFEKLSDALLQNLDIRTSGTDGTNAAAGLDINLKFGDYQNITLDGTKVRTSATGANNNAITVKARDDDTYASDPASLTGLVIKNSDIVTTGGFAIALGNNIINALVGDNAVDGTNGIIAYGGVDDLTVQDNDLMVTNVGIGIEGSDNVEIVRNDIDGGMTGIHLVDTTNAIVGGSAANGNNIKNISGGWNNAGIRIKDGSDHIISHNILENMGGQGIIAEGSWGMADTPLTIADNAITNTAHNAVSLAHWNGAIVSGNAIDGTTTGNGIYLDLARNTQIVNNDIRNIKNDAIHLRRGNEQTTIQGNIIHNAANGIVLGLIGGQANKQTVIGSMGVQDPSLANHISAVGTAIQTDGAYNTWIEGNMINAASLAGIDVKDGTGFTSVNYNDVDASHHGIRLTRTSGMIGGNNIGLNGAMTGHGITVQSSDDTQILSNKLRHIAQRGINIIGGRNIDVRNNELQSIGQNGIRTDQVQNIDISDNKLTNVSWSGIELQGGRDAVVDGNILSNIRGNGIQASGTNAVAITDNILDDIRLAGIYVNNVRGANSVTGNDVSNAGERGFYAAGNNNASIVFAGNVFTDNAVGAQFQSGTIDLTGDANSFTGGTDALIFNPTAGGDASKLVLVNDTLGSTVFSGQGGNYVTLLNGAFYDPGQPTHIGALLSRFDGISASDHAGQILSNADIAALEGKIWHYVDDNTLGRIYFHVPALTAPGYDEEDIMAYFAPANIQSAGMSVTINGMPQVPGATTPQALNSLAPFAGGGDDAAAFLNAIAPAAGDEATARQLSDLSPASGSTQAACWSDAASYMQQGQAVNINYGSSFEDTLNGAADCSGEI